MPSRRNEFEGVETLKGAVMGCIVSGTAESRAANIGISFAGSGEELVCPVFIDREKYASYSGTKDELANQLRLLMEAYVERTHGRK